MIDAFTVIALLAIVAVMVVAFFFGALILKALDKLSARFARPPAGCSFCGTPTDRLEKLIAGPGVAICDSCTRQASAALDDAHETAEATNGHHGKVRCSFCRLGGRDGRALVPSGDYVICGHCLVVCRDILARDAVADPPRP